MRRETGHHTRVTEAAPRWLIRKMRDANEADATGRGVLRETRVRATEESPRGAGNPGGRRRTPAHSRRCPGTVPEVRRRAGARPYRGVELDKCSRCQGVWLDVGELDQVVAEDTGFLGSVRRILA